MSKTSFQYVKKSLSFSQLRSVCPHVSSRCWRDRPRKEIRHNAMGRRDDVQHEIGWQDMPSQKGWQTRYIIWRWRVGSCVLALTCLPKAFGVFFHFISLLYVFFFFTQVSQVSHRRQRAPRRCAKLPPRPAEEAPNGTDGDRSGPERRRLTRKHNRK